MWGSRAVLVGLVVLALVGGCGGSDEPRPGAGAYVALGDSYVSGPGIGTMDPEVPGCLRSDANYAHRVARALGTTSFVDVSCGGEDSAMVRDGRTLNDGTVVGPQLESVSAGTRLVTLGIGANDGNAYLGMFTYCLTPATANRAACAKFAETYMPPVYDETGRHVRSLLAEIKKRAPKARVVLVGYLRIVPESGRCDQLPVDDVNRSRAVAIEEKLNDELRDAASEAAVPFVDVRTISEGHDACAGDEAWVNGVQTVPDDGTLFHPKRAGMQAVADAVLEVVRAG